jgi:outer membrane putative beta-barrel porin/alpha-amylase
MASARTSSASCAALIALGACATLGSPGSVSPDRPGYTDTPVVMPARAVQLEAGVTDDRSGPIEVTPPPVEYISVGETLLRIGLGAQFELRLFGNSRGTLKAQGSRTVSGMEDVKVGVKRSVRAVPDSVHSWLPNVALLVATTLPTGSTALSAGKAQPEGKLAVNWTTASPFSIYSNLGAGKVYSGSLQATREWLSTAIWYAANPRVSLFAEGFVVGYSSGSAGLTGNDDVDGGITYLINDRLQLDARVGHGVGVASETHKFIGVGLAKRW